MKQLKRIGTVVLSLWVVILLTLGVYADDKNNTTNTNTTYDFEVFKEGIIVNQDGRFLPHYITDIDRILFCTTPHATYDSTLELANTYSGKTSGYQTNWSTTNTAPWTGIKTTMQYKLKEHLDERGYQDAAYIYNKTDFPNATVDEKMEYAHAIWASTLSSKQEPPKAGSKAEELIAEATAYDTFYQSIHDKTQNYTNRYHELLQDKTNPKTIVVGVDQTQQKYTVGPLKISYPQRKLQ